MRLMTSIHRRLHALSKQKWKLKYYQDTNFLLNPVNYVDRRIVFEGGYEAAQRKIFFDAIARQGCDTLLDVGANFGLYTCTACVQIPHLQVHAFECDKRNYAQLYANLRINDLLERVSVHEVAVGADNGSVRFMQTGVKNTGASRIDTEAGNIVVSQVRLDDYLTLSSDRLAVKMDVEGAELASLSGMTDLLAQSVRVVQIESFAENARSVEKLMTSLGFVQAAKVDDDFIFEKAGN